METKYLKSTFLFTTKTMAWFLLFQELNWRLANIHFHLLLEKSKSLQKFALISFTVYPY